mmetsp:Transcript_50554/g.93476  ORF Transcript_50554/g.93476 Transcript_50554/m.93476 type:complete len:93 (+) Transcript_50554:481-759(+)
MSARATAARRLILQALEMETLGWECQGRLSCPESASCNPAVKQALRHKELAMHIVQPRPADRHRGAAVSVADVVGFAAADGPEVVETHESVF